MNILAQYDDAGLNSIRHDFNQIEREAYMMPREKLDAIQSAPIKGGVNKGAQTYTFKTVTELGMAKLLAADAKELPQVSTGYKKNTVEIHNIGDSYKFTQEELDSCAYAGIPLESDDARTARRKIDEKVDELIYVGDKDWGVLGLLNNPNVTRTEAENNAAGTSKKWKDKTLDEITADIQKMIDTVFAATKGPRGSGTVEANTIKIPREAYVSLTNRTKGVDSDVTFLKALQDRFAPQGLVNFECCVSAAGVGTVGSDSADRALLYNKGIENVFSIITVPFRVLPAQYQGLSVVFNCIARSAGCVWRRPTTGVYMDGV
ncbi:MAG: encapsulin [Fibrobacter sp.]|nr:encapsulin [Fibrobacter sp.]